jgi:hypothetical protein
LRDADVGFILVGEKQDLLGINRSGPGFRRGPGGEGVSYRLGVVVGELPYTESRL